MKNLILCAVSVVLTGCASLDTGIVLKEEQAVACKQSGCTAWTKDDLNELATHFYMSGVEMGMREGFKQGYYQGYMEGVFDAEAGTQKKRNGL